MNEQLLKDEKHAIDCGHTFNVHIKSGKGQPWVEIQSGINTLSEALILANSFTDYEVGILFNGYIYWSSRLNIFNSSVLYH